MNITAISMTYEEQKTNITANITANITKLIENLKFPTQKKFNLVD